MTEDQIVYLLMFSLFSLFALASCIIFVYYSPYKLPYNTILNYIIHQYACRDLKRLYNRHADSRVWVLPDGKTIVEDANYFDNNSLDSDKAKVRLEYIKGSWFSKDICLQCEKRSLTHKYNGVSYIASARDLYRAVRDKKKIHYLTHSRTVYCNYCDEYHGLVYQKVYVEYKEGDPTNLIKMIESNPKQKGMLTEVKEDEDMA